MRAPRKNVAGNWTYSTGVSKSDRLLKSTVHKDLTERLPNVDVALSEEVAKILAYHKSVRHLRGGEATRIKWMNETKKVGTS